MRITIQRCDQCQKECEELYQLVKHRLSEPVGFQRDSQCLCLKCFGVHFDYIRRSYE